MASQGSSAVGDQPGSTPGRGFEGKAMADEYGADGIFGKKKLDSPELDAKSDGRRCNL